MWTVVIVDILDLASPYIGAFRAGAAAPTIGRCKASREGSSFRRYLELNDLDVALWLKDVTRQTTNFIPRMP
jgi:hypothetical protein